LPEALSSIGSDVCFIGRNGFSSNPTNWSGDHRLSVAEVLKDGSLKRFLDERPDGNRGKNGRAAGRRLEASETGPRQTSAGAKSSVSTEAMRLTALDNVREYPGTYRAFLTKPVKLRK